MENLNESRKNVLLSYMKEGHSYISRYCDNSYLIHVKNSTDSLKVHFKIGSHEVEKLSVCS